jgi:hypothetical protein
MAKEPGPTPGLLPFDSASLHIVISTPKMHPTNPPQAASEQMLFPFESIAKLLSIALERLRQENRGTWKSDVPIDLAHAACCLLES